MCHCHIINHTRIYIKYLMFILHHIFAITKYLIFIHNFYDIIVCEYISYSTYPSLSLHEYNVVVCQLYGLSDKLICVFTLYSLKGLWDECRRFPQSAHSTIINTILSIFTFFRIIDTRDLSANFAFQVDVNMNVYCITCTANYIVS